jgi:hypothetical protein
MTQTNQARKAGDEEFMSSVQKIAEELLQLYSRCEKVLQLIVRYGGNAYVWLSNILVRWDSYKTEIDEQCGPQNIRWIDDYTYECGEHRVRVPGLEARELGAPEWFMEELNRMGLADILNKSESSTRYGIPDAVLETIDSMLQLLEREFWSRRREFQHSQRSKVNDC